MSLPIRVKCAAKDLGPVVNGGSDGNNPQIVILVIHSDRFPVVPEHRVRPESEASVDRVRAEARCPDDLPVVVVSKRYPHLVTRKRGKRLNQVTHPGGRLKVAFLRRDAGAVLDAVFRHSNELALRVQGEGSGVIAAQRGLKVAQLSLAPQSGAANQTKY